MGLYNTANPQCTSRQTDGHALDSSLTYASYTKSAGQNLLITETVIGQQYIRIDKIPQKKYKLCKKN